MTLTMLRAVRRSLPVLLLGLAPLAAGAQAITGLWSTGVDATGNPLPVGSTDAHYQVLENGNSQGIVTFHPAWVQDGNSSWIWQQADGQPGNVARTFRTTFTLAPGYNLATAWVSGRWSTDNAGLDIFLNGVSQGQTSPSYSAFTPFLVLSGFVTGTNTLDFQVLDQGPPGALNVTDMSGDAQLDVVVATPEPASVLLLATGFLGLGAVRLRRNRKA